MELLKIFLIGIGGYGANYIKELLEREPAAVVIEGICEVSKTACGRYPVIKEMGIPIYSSPEEFYMEHKADLAVVSSPIHLHYQQIVTCLRNRSHVLTEKPVCTTMEEARGLLREEQQSGCFVAVGYQLNFQRDVLQMKRDILSGKFGKPILMKAMHAMRRGEHYYNRNNWAGRKCVNGCLVNDSPFNNACAHQFQNMTFLLGDTLDRSASISEVHGELYQANREIENFDTAAICAISEDGVPLYYYTTHNLKKDKLGPMAEYHFQLATIYYGKDFGDGPVNEYIVEMKDGRQYSYADIPKGERLQKLYDAIECARTGGHPISTVQCAMAHLEAVNQLAAFPVRNIHEGMLEFFYEGGERYCTIKNLEEVFRSCYLNQQMPSEVDSCW